MIEEPDDGQNQDETDCVGDEARKRGEVSEITSALQSVVEKLERANDETTPEKKADRIWERVGIGGLWTAAIVGLIAVFVASHDSEKQRGIMQGTLDEMRVEQRPNLWYSNNLSGPEFRITDTIHQTGEIVWLVNVTDLGKDFIAGGTQKSFIELGTGTVQPSYDQTTTAISPIAPGQNVGLTVKSKPGYTKAAFEALLKQDPGITIVILANYFDFAGNQYQARMCLSTLASGVINFCMPKADIK